MYACSSLQMFKYDFTQSTWRKSLCYKRGWKRVELGSKVKFKKDWWEHDNPVTKALDDSGLIVFPVQSPWTSSEKDSDRLVVQVSPKRSQVPSLSSSVGQRGPWGADPANRAMHPYVISNKVMNVEGDHFFLHGFWCKMKNNVFSERRPVLGKKKKKRPLAGFIILWLNYLAKKVMKLENFRVVRRVLFKKVSYKQETPSP